MGPGYHAPQLQSRENIFKKPLTSSQAHKLTSSQAHKLTGLQAHKLTSKWFFKVSDSDFLVALHTIV